MKIFKTKKYSILGGVLKYSFVIMFGFMLMTPFVFVNAGGDTVGDNTGTNINTKINNPLGADGPQNIQDFIKVIVEAVVYIGIPIVALAIIYTGFLFVKAQGNPEAITKAKMSLLYTLIGGALLLGAFVIANAIGKTVEDITSTT